MASQGSASKCMTATPIIHDSKESIETSWKPTEKTASATRKFDVAAKPLHFTAGIEIKASLKCLVLPTNSARLVKQHSTSISLHQQAIVSQLVQVIITTLLQNNRPPTNVKNTQLDVSGSVQIQKHRASRFRHWWVTCCTNDVLTWPNSAPSNSWLH